MSIPAIYQFRASSYTGSLEQPNLITFYAKGDANTAVSFCSAVPVYNAFGIFPLVSIVTGAERIFNAVKVIFEKIALIKFVSDDANLLECWNAVKNIIRGLVEMIPLTAIAIIIYDTTVHMILENKIERELREENNVCGMAVDGRIVSLYQIADLILLRPAFADMSVDELSSQIAKVGLSQLVNVAQQPVPRIETVWGAFISLNLFIERAVLLKARARGAVEPLNAGEPIEAQDPLDLEIERLSNIQEV